jgi:NADH-quinone oxidoreductase subunit M
MEEFSGILTGILFFPIIGAIIIFLLDEKAKNEARWIAAFATGASLALGLLVFFTYDVDMARDEHIGYDDPTAVADTQSVDIDGETKSYELIDFQFVDNFVWVDDLGIRYQLGVDGLTAAMVMLTGLASFAGVLISWGIDDRPREFMAMFLLLVAGVYGVFVSTDTFLLMFFYELAIFPMYFLIAIWGWKDLREYAAMKLTLYILIGSVVALVGILVLYFQAGSFFTEHPDALPISSDSAYSFEFNHLHAAAQLGAYDVDYLGFDGLTVGRFWFPFIFIGFAVLAGLFPFHNWSPDGHVAAPTAVSMIHAGV